MTDFSGNQYFGKYRGLVVNNVDPERSGRLLVTCPHVRGPTPAWAMPCVPFAGPLEGFFMMPTIGSNVWVEFEAGDPNLPIWSGCFWNIGQVPPTAALPTTRTIKTMTCELTLDDVQGVRVQVLPPAAPAPATITINPTGAMINIGAATITLDPVRVDVNNGALTVV